MLTTLSSLFHPPPSFFHFDPRYVLGKEAMERMAKASVLITGMNGVGVETAKNVILAGVRRVTVHDDTPATLADMSSNFYITADDVASKRPRAKCCVSKLK